MLNRATGKIPELPPLDAGVHRFLNAYPQDGILHAIVVNHLLTHGSSSRALWIDSHGNSRTQPLARVAPSKRTLDRVDVARGFTPHQHYALLEELETQVEPETSLIVVPEIDWFYRGDDVSEKEGQRMLDHGMEFIAEVQAKAEIPVLITRTTRDRLTESIQELSDGQILCQKTSQGPRFSGEGFETLVYHVNGLLQTTITYWDEILAERNPELADPNLTPEVAVGAN